MSTNIVIITGNLTRDPESKVTTTGKTVVRMSVAVNDGWGEKKRTHFLTVSAWDKLAENCAKFLAKGRQVLVRGRLDQRSWEKDGQKRSTIEIVADDVQFLGGANDKPAADKPAAADDQADAGDPGMDDLPF